MRLRILITAVLLLLVFLAQGACAEQQLLLPEHEVRSAVERFLAERQAINGWELAVRQLTIPQGTRIRPGARDLEIVAPTGWSGWEPVSVALVVRVDGRVEKNLSLRLTVDARAEMVVATRQLPAGTVLTAGDLQLQRLEVSLAGGQQVSRIDDAVGKKLKAAVRPGMPLREGQLAAVPVVVSGQLVTIIADNGGVRIAVSGRARSSGGIGELIRVQNLMSMKEMSARVLDASTVEVGF